MKSKIENSLFDATNYEKYMTKLKSWLSLFLCRLKKIFVWLYYKFTLRFCVALVLSLLFASIYLPYPFDEELFPGTGANNFYVTFPSLVSKFVKIENPNFEVFESLLNFPSGLRYYNFNFKHLSEVKENKLSTFTILGSKDHIFWGKYNKNDGCDGLGCDIASGEKGDYFPLNIGGILSIKAVPVDTPISYGVVSLCEGDKISRLECGKERELEKNIYFKNLKIYATPNGFSWFIQMVLILAFWVVVTNNLSEITRQRDKSFRNNGNSYD